MSCRPPSVLGLRAARSNSKGRIVGLAAAIRVCSRPSGLAAHTAIRRLKHRPDDALEREEDQHDREKQDREFENLADEPKVAVIAAEQVENGGDANRSEREEQQQAYEDQGASVALTTADVVAARRAPGSNAGHHAGESCQPWNAEGTSAGSAKVMISNASVRASSARATALLSPWPDLNAVYCPINGCPSR